MLFLCFPTPKLGGGGGGTCFNFHSGKGGDPSPLDPIPPSPGPPPPLPPQLKCTREPGVWEHFLVWEKIFGAFGACHTLCAYCSMCAPYTLFSRLPCPNARCQCISAPRSRRCPAQNMKTQLTRCSILGLKIGSPVIKGKKPTTRHKRHVPHFFLSVPMATLCEFVAVAQKMATRDRFRRV